MSKQLAISACASIFAMAALAVFSAPQSVPGSPSYAANEQGAAVEAATPRADRIAPALFDFTR
ncbi:hypothetical protein [Aurantiacibacter marinus]|uniref:hypothetical protein n=1 Tax=Aurantiacibacter marinus TaxID=874156 RepID=UPI000A96C15F|nr:hypothetical protein [Aurantiacibacter marinus]